MHLLVDRAIALDGNLDTAAALENPICRSSSDRLGDIPLVELLLRCRCGGGGNTGISVIGRRHGYDEQATKEIGPSASEVEVGG